MLTAIIVFTNYFADRVVKWIAMSELKGREPLVFLKGTIVIIFTENSGAFLSLGSTWPVCLKYAVLLLVPVGVCLYGIYYLMFREHSTVRIIIIGTIIGGGLGNLVDRLFNNFMVIDYLNFGIGNLRTGILNVADLSVTFGAIAFVLYEWKMEKRNRKENAGA